MDQYSEFATHVLRRVLRNYQAAWVRQFATQPFVAILGARQMGKDFTIAWWCALNLLCPGSTWNIVSATRGHATQFIRDVDAALQVLEALARESGVRFPQRVSDSVLEIRLDNGAGVFSLAATPRSIVGRRGSFILNEVSALPHAESIFETSYPIVTQARQSGKHAQYFLVGNASHRGSYWHHLWTGGALAGWRRIKTTWTQAQRLMGHTQAQVDRDRRAIVATIGVGAYLQWYECVWRSPTESFLSPVVLDAARWTNRPDTTWPMLLGYDVGRINDPSAFVRAHVAPESHGGFRAGSRYLLRGERLYATSYVDQRAHLRKRVEAHDTQRVLIDATGNDDLAIQCRTELGPVVQPFRFSAASKWELFSALKDDFETGALWLDPSDTDLRMELEGISAEAREGGPPKIILPRDSASAGHKHHGDLAVAAALCNYAGRAQARAAAAYTPSTKTRRTTRIDHW